MPKKLHAGHALLALIGFMAVIVGCVAVKEKQGAIAYASQARLVGLACGPERLTLTAAEEDEFPYPCEAIETPQALCGHDDADECAAYMGDGY